MKKNPYKKQSLSLQMLVALAAGVVFGVCAPGLSAKLSFVSTMFAHGIKMAVMPLIFLSATLGTFQASMQRARLGKTALLSIGFFLVATLLAATLGLGLNMLFRPGLDASLAPTVAMPKNLASSIDWTQFVVDLVPTNIVAALASGNALPVLVFGVLLGSALSAIGERATPTIGVMESLLGAFFKMIEWIVALSPLAIFSALATLLASKGVSALTPLIKLLGAAYLGLAILALLLTLIIKATGLSPLRVIKSVSEPLILAFTTRSSEITFPVHLKKLTEMGVPRSIAATILPLSYIFNRDGAVLYTALAVGYLADVYHIVWSWPLALTIIVLTTITIDGAANVPSGALVAITAILSAVGVPVEAVVLILGIDAFFDMGRTTLNVYASTSAIAVAMKLSGERRPEEAEPEPAGSLDILHGKA